MKLPDNIHIEMAEIQTWFDAAQAAGLKYGIYVSVVLDYSGGLMATATSVKRIYFLVDNHEFDSLSDLEKALQNKVFL